MDANDCIATPLRTILFAGLGAFGGTIVGVGVGVLNLTLNSDCTSGEDEGACAMGIPLIAVGFPVVGGGITGVITLVRWATFASGMAREPAGYAIKC